MFGQPSDSTLAVAPPPPPPPPPLVRDASSTVLNTTEISQKAAAATLSTPTPADTTLLMVDVPSEVAPQRHHSRQQHHQQFHNSTASHGMSTQEEQLRADMSSRGLDHDADDNDDTNEFMAHSGVKTGRGGASTHSGGGHSSSSSSSSVNNKNAKFAVQWIQASFEPYEGAHIAREVLYQEYCDHCQINGRAPMNSASFGKVIRAVFPGIATRRLGTRGNSKYHYYGIKPAAGNAADYGVIMKDAPRSSKFKICPATGNPVISPPKQRAISSADHVGVRRVVPTEETVVDLLRLPPIDASRMPPGADPDSVNEFFRLYREHCHHVLTCGLQGRFSDFGEAIILFWRAVPDELFPVLEYRETCRGVSEWDAMLFQSMLTVFLPDILSPGDKYMLKELRNFTKQLPLLLGSAFQAGHELMFAEKSRVAHDFNKIVKQYYHLNQLALNADHVATQHTVLDSMISVWGELDFESITVQAVYVCANAAEAMRLVQENVYAKLESRANVMQWAEWIFAMTEEFICGDTQTYDEYTYFAQQFIIRWHYIASLIMRDIGERSKEYFVPFHYIRLFCDEYVKYLIDCKLDEKRRQLEGAHQQQQQQQQQHDAWSHAQQQSAGGSASAFAQDIFSHPFDVSAHELHQPQPLHQHQHHHHNSGSSQQPHHLGHQHHPGDTAGDMHAPMFQFQQQPQQSSMNPAGGDFSVHGHDSFITEYTTAGTTGTGPHQPGSQSTDQLTSLVTDSGSHEEEVHRQKSSFSSSVGHQVNNHLMDDTDGLLFGGQTVRTSRQIMAAQMGHRQQQQQQQQRDGARGAAV